jgi:hypothetical protein
MADSNESRGKTLDEIRNELAAAYPVVSEAEQPAIRTLEEDAAAVERVRSVERHRDRRRRYAMAAALAGITVSLLVVGGYALTREPAQPNALASAPDVTAPSAAPGKAVREPQPAAPIVQPAAPIVQPAAVAELERQLKALSSDVKALTERLQRWDSRIGGIESQVQGVESSMRRLVDDAAAATATRAAERAASVPRRTATAPAVVAAPIEPRTDSAPERSIPAVKLAVPESSPAAKEIKPAEETRVTADVAPPAATTRNVGETAKSETPSTLRGKISAEWRTIKQGFAGAGDDFKAAMRDLGRKMT